MFCTRVIDFLVYYVLHVCMLIAPEVEVENIETPRGLYGKEYGIFIFLGKNEFLP